ncbi:MAG: hypothetical protein ACHQK8_09410, partial [Bacteroidia bacterium]
FSMIKRRMKHIQKRPYAGNDFFHRILMKTKLTLHDGKHGDAKDPGKNCIRIDADFYSYLYRCDRLHAD